MRPLSGIDSMFLSLESRTNLFQVGAVAVLDPSTAPAGSPPPYEALRRVIEGRLDRLPLFRRRLAEVPGGLDHPRWAEVPPEFERHLRHGALPAPGGERELASYAADVLGRPLDRRRPLWEIDVVEGLENGLVAGVAKVHHCAVDGIGGTEVTGALMDLEPQVARPAAHPSVGSEPVPGSLSLLRGATRRGPRRARSAARLGLRLAGTTALIRGRNRRLDTVPPPAPFTGPRTPLSARLGADRVVGLAQVDRADVETVRHATGVSVNDVVLALTASVLRLHLAGQDALPNEPLVAFVPVSVRAPSGTFDDRVNQLSGMLVSLATNTADPVVRLMAVAESARAAKHQHRVLGEDLFHELAELVPPVALHSAGALVRALGLTSRFPPFNVVVSSFPGPDTPLYCGGAALLSYHPFGPVIDGAALSVTAMSYRNQIGFGLLACRDAIPPGDMALLSRGIPESMRELTKAVGGRGQRSRVGTRPEAPDAPGRREAARPYS